MTDALNPCPRCRRHIRAREPACVFCDHRLSIPSRHAAVVVGATLVAALTSTPEVYAQTPRELFAQAPAAAYGAPPSPSPIAPSPRDSGATTRVGDFDVHGVDAATARRAMTPAHEALRRCITPGTPVETLRVMLRVSPEGRVRGVALRGVRARDVRCVRGTLMRTRWRGASGPRVGISLRRGTPAPGSRCGRSPAGCRSTGCGAGLVCQTVGRCVPSSCSCDPRTGHWRCTADCGGGMCVPAPRAR